MTWQEELAEILNALFWGVAAGMALYVCNLAGILVGPFLVGLWVFAHFVDNPNSMR